jgi:beta-N-acetylhexosaminidase
MPRLTVSTSRPRRSLAVLVVPLVAAVPAQAPAHGAARDAGFIAAGGDLVLIVSPSVLPAMYRAVLARAATNATFRWQVDAAVLRVLAAKARVGVCVTS